MTSEIRVRQYTSADASSWDEFVDASFNGTMFHKQAFLAYHQPDRFQFHHLVFERDNNIVALLPGGLRDNNSVFWSPMGASYGSFVTKDISYEMSQAIVDAFLDYGSGQQWTDAYIIPPPVVYAAEFNQHIEYAMLYRKFGFELHYISHAIDLKHGSDYLQHFDKTARKTVRKVRREGHIRIEESEDYDTFYEILLENKSKHNATPTHSRADLERLRALTPQHLKLFLVYYGDIAIGGSLLFLCNDRVVLCFYNMLRYEYEHLKPIYLIMDETVRWSTEQGYRWVDIGVSQVPTAEDPMTPAMSLIAFKERFNSRGLLRTTYHYRFGSES